MTLNTMREINQKAIIKGLLFAKHCACRPYYNFECVLYYRPKTKFLLALKIGDFNENQWKSMI